MSRIETVPNEILLHLFSYLSWSDLLTSFWSLNARFNSVICSALSRSSSTLNTGILLTQSLSYHKCTTVLFPLIINSPSLVSSIQRIHLDETSSMACDLVYEWLFNEKKILHFPNLKSLLLTRCGSVEPVVQSLNYLIEHQLNDLTLSFDEDVLRSNFYVKNHSIVTNEAEIKTQMAMLKQLVFQLFSNRCHLTSLRLDISNVLCCASLQECLEPSSYVSSTSVQHKFQSICVTLRCLHIRLCKRSFLENLIECVPNLEELSVEFNYILKFGSFETPNVETLSQSDGNWFKKVPKLRYFRLTTFISTDLEFAYLKWLLNNLNYIEKLQVHLRNNEIIDTQCQNIWKSAVDANFIRQNCLPANIMNLIYFDFYICLQRQLSLDDIENITDSFKIHPFFVSHQWTNVKCLFDPIMSCQHLFSSFSDRLQSSDNLTNHLYIFNWPKVAPFGFRLYPSLYLFLEEFNGAFSNIRHIKVYKGCKDQVKDFDPSELQMSLNNISNMKQYKTINMPFRNVTKIQFGTWFKRKDARIDEPIARNETREKLLAHLISMTVQLKYLLVEQFEWLLHVVQYASTELRTNALSTVRHVEFCLTSCHYGYNKANHLGKQLVPFLSKYMPHLQALRLWRPDDFPWTSIRCDDGIRRTNQRPLQRWIWSLETPESIVQHTNIFERDLFELIRQLKQFVFLDIRGKIPGDKVEAYRSMVQTRFPHSRSEVKTTIFRLWL